MCTCWLVILYSFDSYFVFTLLQRVNSNKGLSIKPHRVQFVLNPKFYSEIPYQHVVYTRFVLFFSVSMLAASMCARAGHDRGQGLIGY